MPIWNTEKDDRLKALWPTGMPTRQIAAALDTTNGAVAGRARRLGLPFRSGPKAASGHALVAKRQARQRKKKSDKENPFGNSKVFEKQYLKIEEKMLAADAGRIGIPILVKKDGLLYANEKLHGAACRWPISGGCCARDAVKGSSYCPTHLRRSSGVPVRISQNAIPVLKTAQLLLFPDILEPIARKFEAAA